MPDESERRMYRETDDIVRKIYKEFSDMKTCVDLMSSRLAFGEKEFLEYKNDFKVHRECQEKLLNDIQIDMVKAMANCPYKDAIKETIKQANTNAIDIRELKTRQMIMYLVTGGLIAEAIRKVFLHM